MTKAPPKAILDTSVVLAWVRGERGANTAKVMISQGAMSAVNLAEVLLRAKARGYQGTLDQLATDLENMGLTIVDFDAEQAAIVPYVDAAGQKFAREHPSANGTLSLADCACIATGIHLGLPIISDETLWVALGLNGVTISGFR